MRLSVYLIVFQLFAIHATVFSQNVVTMKGKDIPLKSALVQIEQEAQVKLVYRDETISDFKVTFDFQNSTIQETLNVLLKGTGNTYRVLENNLIAITPLEFVQGINVSGTVTDENGDPLPGVNVVVKGTSTGVITGANGMYSINVPDADAVLVFSFMGYASQEIMVGIQRAINVSLSVAVREFEEVVITALGLRREQKSLGYSTSTVKGENMNQGAQSNMLKSLQGKTTGVDIVNLTSDPTSSVYVTIRGATSIQNMRDNNLSNAAQPLYVLDGIPIGNGDVSMANQAFDYGNAMSRLNPNDIESITVLKGASAGALYGARAGNGVIMITTKSGAGARKGVGVSVSSAVTFDKMYGTLKTQNEFLQGTRYDNFNMNTLQGWGTRKNSDFAKLDHKQWDLAKQEYYYGPLKHYTDEDRVLAFMQTGISNTNDVVVTGNYDRGNYRFSYQNLTNIGVMPNNTTNRNSIGFSGMYKILEKLTINTSANFTRTYSPNKTPFAGQFETGVMEVLYGTRSNHPEMSVWRDAPVWVDGFEGRLQNTPWLDDNGGQMTREGSTSGQNNPYFRVYNTIQKHMVDDVFGKVELDYQIIDPLRIMLRSGMQKSQFYYEKRASWDNTSYREGQFHRENTNTTQINTDLMLLYNQRVGDFDISATGGFNYVYSDSYRTRQEFNNLSRPEDFSLGAASGGAGSISNQYGWGTGRTQSLFATASVGWKSMIYLEGSLRNDWYGLTELDKKSNLYPSVSGSWLISETFQLPDWFDLAKVRLGRAQVGYGIPTYINANTYGFSNDWAGISLGTVGGGLIDPKLKPETNVTVEGGFDLAFINNRVNFEFTYFNKKHIDQIGNLPVVSSTGFSTMTANVGEVVSKGIEMALNVTPVRNRDWTWSIGANYSSAKAKITKMNDDFDELWLDRNGQQTKLHIAVGEVMGNTWAQHNPYVIKSGKFAGKKLMNNNSGTLGYSENSDRFALVGSFNPDFTMGFHTDLRYKRFHLNVVAALRVGGVYSSETHKRLRENGVTPDTFSGNDKWWVGGRVGYGGLPWPDPDAMQTPETRALVANTRKDFDDASRTVGVFVDPRSDEYQYDEELGDKTFQWNGLTLPVYVENGADPTNTYWLTPNNAMYTNMRWFLHDRTWDATNFKLREITLSYDLPVSLTQKFGCQGASVSFIAKNVFRWNKSGQFEDPESAFSGSTGQMQGISRYLVPPIASYGFRLLLNF